MIPREPIIEFPLIGGPLDGGGSIWCAEEMPRENRDEWVIPLPPPANDIKALYRFRDGAWRYVRSFDIGDSEELAR